MCVFKCCQSNKKRTVWPVMTFIAEDMILLLFSIIHLTNSAWSVGCSSWVKMNFVSIWRCKYNSVKSVSKYPIFKHCAELMFTELLTQHSHKLYYDVLGLLNCCECLKSLIDPHSVFLNFSNNLFTNLKWILRLPLYTFIYVFIIPISLICNMQHNFWIRKESIKYIYIWENSY